MSAYRLNFEKLCGALGLGRLTSEPKPISGGFLHRMFEVNTETGRYAVKALNPEIMGREKALANFEFSESVAHKMSESLNVSCAKRHNGAYVQNVDGQYYLVYDFLEGDVLNAEEITAGHAYQIGCALAKIHGTDFSELGSEPEDASEHMEFAWDTYAKQGREKQLVWAALFEENLEELKRLSAMLNRALDMPVGRQNVCHCDLDPKNVMWLNGAPVILDWESAGWLNLSCDFLETALYWSQNADGSVKRERFLAFAQGYASQRELEETDWSVVLYRGLSSKFGWLEYNLKRSLGLACGDASEQRLGTEQVMNTVRDIRAYTESFEEVAALLNEARERKPVLLPRKIKELVGNQPCVMDGIGRSDATVAMYAHAILKVEPHKQSFPRVVAMMEWLKGKLPVPEVLAALTEDGTDYLLMTKIEGKMACDGFYMERPELLVSLLAEALKMLWQVDISGCPYERTLDAVLEEAKYNVENGLVDMDNVQPDTFGENGFAGPEALLAWLNENRPEPEPVLSHGDFCLPNLFLNGDGISGLIDLGDTGVGDKWNDIAICYRSLKNNAEGIYGEKRYPEISPELLFTKLGVEPDWEKIRYYILLDELF